jgi:hypothetical protein
MCWLTQFRLLESLRNSFYKVARDPKFTKQLKSSAPDYKPLLAELRAHIRGEVRFDNGSRALYSTDASNYRQIPIGVVSTIVLISISRLKLALRLSAHSWKQRRIS